MSLLFPLLLSPTSSDQTTKTTLWSTKETERIDLKIKPLLTISKLMIKSTNRSLLLHHHHHQMKKVVMKRKRMKKKMGLISVIVSKAMMIKTRVQNKRLKKPITRLFAMIWKNPKRLPLFLFLLRSPLRISQALLHLHLHHHRLCLQMYQQKVQENQHQSKKKMRRQSTEPATRLPCTLMSGSVTSLILDHPFPTSSPFFPSPFHLFHSTFLPLWMNLPFRLFSDLLSSDLPISITLFLL